MVRQSNRNELRVFLSSNFDLSTRRSRDLFRTELLSRFNLTSGQYGINTFLVDYEYGIPAGTPITDVIDLCVSSVIQSDLFFCILNTRYGKPVPYASLTEEQKELASRKNLIHEDVSVLELEILAAEASGVPSIFFIQESKEREPQLDELISLLAEQHAEIVAFSDIEELAVKAQVCFVKFLTNIECTIATSDFNAETAILQLAARKLRYFCPNEQISSQINDYISGDDAKPLQIFGNTGSGKTTYLLNWLVVNQHRLDIVIVKWFSEVGPNNSLGALKLLLDQIGIDIARFNYEEEAIIALHNFWSAPHDIRYVFLIDGAEDLADAKDFWGQLLSAVLSANVRVVVTRTSPSKTQADSSAISIDIKPIKCETLIETIYQKEWKQLEYPTIKHIANDYLNAVEPYLITLIMQQALREIRYINIFENKNATPQQIILDRLCAIRSEWDVFIAQKEHLEAIQFPWDIVSSLILVACSEKGLTIKELSDIIGESPHFVYQFYFILTTDEDLISIPDTIKTKLLGSLSSDCLAQYRSLLLQYFTVHQSDRATIERYYQMTELNDYKGATELVQDLCQWRIIKNNSTKPFLTKVLLTRKEQQKMLVAWQKEITTSPNNYAEKDIYTAAVTAREMGCLEEAALFMQSLLRGADPDLLSRASYLQNLADIHDELDDISAVNDIAASIECMLHVPDRFTAQQMIDVYRAAAEIGSHFAFAEAQNKFDFEKPLREKAEEWISKVIELTEGDWNKSVYLRNLSYHSVAYSYYNLGKYQLAYKWIVKAITFSRDGELIGELVDDLFQKAQICLEAYRENHELNSLDESESAITEAASVSQSKDVDWSDNEKRSIASKILNTWSNILCEKGIAFQEDTPESERYFEQAISKMKKAISLDRENQTTDLYLSYHNIGVYYLNAMRIAKKDYFSEGLHFAKLAKKEAERMHNAQSDFDLADIFMLLAQLYHENSQILLSHRYLWKSMRIHKKYKSSLYPLPAEQVFPIQSRVDTIFFHLENLFMKCYTFAQ